VGEDVYSVFKDSDSESVSSFKLSNNKDKWIFSLKQECVRRLQKFDIPVITNTFCTFKDEQLFYSYRRNSTSKRMVTLAWRQK
jgi:copper oxidase (laccase) domain-containing protein